MNVVRRWQPGCWCAAKVLLCEAHGAAQDGEIVHRPEQWACLLWGPREDALPYVDPVAWGIGPEPPYAWIHAEIGDDPIYFLRDHELDLPALLLWLLAEPDHPPWLRAILYARLDGATAARARQRAGSEGQRTHEAFRSFMRRLLE